MIMTVAPVLEEEDRLQNEYFYDVHVGIVKFPKDRISRFKVYKILKRLKNISLGEFAKEGGFDYPFYVGVLTGYTNYADSYPEIKIESKLSDQNENLFRYNSDIFFDAVKKLEEVGCKMLLVNKNFTETGLPDDLPEEYIEEFTIHINWFQKFLKGELK